MLYEQEGDEAPLQMLRKTLGLDNYIKPIPRDRDPRSLVEGKTDVFPGYLSNEAFYFYENKIPINIISPESYGVDFYGDILFAGEREVREHPERVRRLIRASLKGWRYALENPDEVIALIRKRYGSAKSLEHLRYEAKVVTGAIATAEYEMGRFNPGRLQYMARAFTRMGLLSRGEVPPGLIFEDILINEGEVEFSSKERAWLAAHPVVTLATPENLPPFSFRDGKGEYQGPYRVPPLSGESAGDQVQTGGGKASQSTGSGENRESAGGFAYGFQQ